MRLKVKQGDKIATEHTFTEGPVYIGRRSGNQVCLPGKTVSKQHAVIFQTQDGKWIIEDLQSVNGTQLNDLPVQKGELENGDTVQICDYTIDVSIDDRLEETAHMEDTLRIEAALTTPPHEIIVRRPDAGHAPAMRLAARRLMDFSQATELICKAGTLDELLQVLLNVLLKQFEAFHVYCALREQPSGPMQYEAGKKRDGQPVRLEELNLKDKISQVVDKGQFLVLPRVAAAVEAKERIRSALIAAIIRPNGCMGVMYVDNAMIHNHYSLSDLDYLMMLSMHTAAVLHGLMGL